MTKDKVDKARKIWEWSGWTFNGAYWFSPFPSESSVKKLPELTLDNLFKYAVPTIIGKGYGIVMHYDRFGKVWEVEIYGTALGSTVAITTRDKELKEALAQAILKVIEGKK